jgi:hypothetical protein
VETSSDAAGAESARDVLASAVSDLKAADSGQFSQQVQVASGANVISMEHEGRYRLSANRFEVATDTSEASGSLITRFVEGVAYMNSPAWSDGMEQCWLVIDVHTFGSATGLAVDLSGAPEVVAALDVVEGESFGAEGLGVIEGSVDLSTAVHLMISARYAVDLTQGLEGRVQARFEMDDGSLSAWSVQGQDVATAIASTTELDDDFAAFLPAIDMRIEYTAQGDPVDVDSPSADSLMTSEEMNSGDGCSLM